MKSARPSGDPLRDDVVHRTARNVVVRGIAEVLGKFATLAWTVMAARMLSQHDFGAVNYALYLMLLVSALPTWGFDVGLTRQGSAEPETLPRLYAEVLLLKTVISLPVFVVTGLLFSRQGLGQEEAIVLFLLLASGLPELWSFSARAASAARQSPLGISTALVFQRILTACLVVGALVAGTGGVGAAGAVLAGTTFGWIAHVSAVRRLGVKFRLRSLRWESLRELLRGTFLIGLGAVTLMVLFRVDTVMLGLLDGHAAVATYAVAYRLLETVLFVSHAINQAIFPVMSAAETAERVRRGYENALAVAAFVYLPFAAVSLIEGRRIIGMLFGDLYAAPSASILAWLAPAPMLFAAAFFGASVLVSRNRNADNLTAAVLATAANVALNLLLIPRYSGVGAAITTSVSYAVQLIVLYVAMRRNGVEANLWRPLAESAIASIVLASLLLLLRTNLVLELAVGGTVYLCVWLALARRSAPDRVRVVQRIFGLRQR